MLNRLIIGLMPLVPKFIVGRVASRYIAGDKLQDAVDVARKLNAEGAMTTIDLLGEHTRSREGIEATVKTYRDILAAIDREKLDSNISLKPTHIGLGFDNDFCAESIEKIVQTAAGYGNFVRIDMEDHPYTDDTLRIYHELHKKYGNVGVVIQSYLRRTINDIPSLIKAKANLRLCKGIYNEPRNIAYKQRDIIIRNYSLLLEELLSGGCYVGIATHCEETVWHALKIIHKLKLSREQYEFQMLLGVDPQLKTILLKEGHRLRVYIPFGVEWYPYSTRRLKENPAIAGHVARDLLRFNRNNNRV